MWLQGRLAHLSEPAKINLATGEKNGIEKSSFPLDQPAELFHPRAVPSVAETQEAMGAAVKE